MVHKSLRLVGPSKQLIWISITGLKTPAGWRQTSCLQFYLGGWGLELRIKYWELIQLSVRLGLEFPASTLKFQCSNHLAMRVFVLKKSRIGHLVILYFTLIDWLLWVLLHQVQKISFFRGHPNWRCQGVNSCSSKCGSTCQGIWPPSNWHGVY